MRNLKNWRKFQSPDKPRKPIVWFSAINSLWKVPPIYHTKRVFFTQKRYLCFFMCNKKMIKPFYLGLCFCLIFCINTFFCLSLLLIHTFNWFFFLFLSVLELPFIIVTLSQLPFSFSIDDVPLILPCLQNSCSPTLCVNESEHT